MSLAAVAGAFDAAFDAFLVAERLGLDRRHSADDLLLERALLTDDRLLRAAVERERPVVVPFPHRPDHSSSCAPA